MKRSLLLPGIKKAEVGPHRKKKERKSKIITMIISLPLLLLIEHFLFDVSFSQYWMIIIFAYVCFFVVPFAIGVCVKTHLWNKLLINACIPIICMVVLLGIWKAWGGKELEEVREILITTIFMLIIGSSLTILGNAIYNRIITKI